MYVSLKLQGVLSTSWLHTLLPTPFILECKPIPMNAPDELPIRNRAPARGLQYLGNSPHLGHICLPMHDFWNPIDIQTALRLPYSTPPSTSLLKNHLHKNFIDNCFFLFSIYLTPAPQNYLTAGTGVHFYPPPLFHCLFLLREIL